VVATADLEAAFRRHYPALREKCRRMLRDSQEADDVAQETFVRLWNADLGSALGANDGRLVTAWIYKTSTRIAIDRIRARQTRSRLAPAPEDVAPDLAAGFEARAGLERLAAELPERELELLLLHRWDGLTHPEIAEVTGHSARTVRRVLKRCEGLLANLAVAEKEAETP
jgi:RNA polymerase sigma-70 factor (ECF subfamily)